LRAVAGQSPVQFIGSIGARVAINANRNVASRCTPVHDEVIYLHTLKRSEGSDEIAEQHPVNNGRRVIDCHLAGKAARREPRRITAA
jgi:hypothetical protein